MKKNLLLFLSLFFLFSCSEQKEISVEDLQETIEEVEDNLDELKPNVFSLEDNNQLMFSNGDKINVYKKNDFVIVELSEENKNHYSFGYYYDDDLLKLNFTSHTIVSSLTNDLNYLNKVNKFYIKNNKVNNFEFQFIEGNEINIFSNDNNFEYNNLSNINIKKYNETYAVIINLTNTNHCNKNNSIVFDKNKLNINIIELQNSFNFSNLKCGKENILLFNNDYVFEDKRDFSFFSDEIIISSKKEVFEKLNNKDIFINTVMDDNYVYINLNNLDKFNYSLDYEYEKKHKSLNIIINKIPENWISVNKIKINKNIFYKIDKLNTIQRNYEDSLGRVSLEKHETEDYDLISFKNKNDYYFSYINNLKCNYFSDQIMIDINNIEDKADLLFIKGKEKKCRTYETKKVAINHSLFNIKNININKNIFNIGLKDYFEINYDNKFKFNYNSDYKVYNYKVVNNQLYLYIDKENKNYNILNKPLKEIEIEQFSNINIINLYNDSLYQEVINDNLKVYRDFNEKLKANIRRYRGNTNYQYYSMRFNSISLNNDNLTCNKEPFDIDVIQEEDKAYSLIINKQNKLCGNSGIGLIVTKLIGNDIDIDFVDKREDNYLDELRKEHDKVKYYFKNLIKHLDIDFEYDVFYINETRRVVFKINEFNKNSDFYHEVKLSKNGKTIILELTETESLNSNKENYFSIDTNDPFNEIKVILNEFNKTSNFKISLNNT